MGILLVSGGGGYGIYLSEFHGTYGRRRNARWKEGKSRPPNVNCDTTIQARMLQDVETLFKPEKFKAVHRRSLEAEAMSSWSATTPIINQTRLAKEEIVTT